MSQNIPDQRPVWDKKHGAGDHDILREVPSPFSEIAEPYFPPNAHILELGCGVGRDAVYFADHDHTVVATDGSEVVIEQNRDRISNDSVSFESVNMTDALPYDDVSFDVVYTNLALHYYSDQKTREIVAEIARVLRPGGVFAFACKSYDSLHNAGEEIEKNVFVSSTGVTIHLFSEEYVQDLVKGVFAIEHIDEEGEEYNGRFSKIVRCVAKKITE